MYDLIGVIMAPTQNQDYIEGIQAFWKSKAETAIPELATMQPPKPQGRDKALPWEFAGNLLLRQFATMKRVNGVG